MSAEALRQVQRRAMLGLAAVIGLLFVTGFSDLYGDVTRARRDGELERVCRPDWNDNLLNGVRVGTKTQWQDTLSKHPELLVRICSTNAGGEP